MDRISTFIDREMDALPRDPTRKQLRGFITRLVKEVAREATQRPKAGRRSRQ